VDGDLKLLTDALQTPRCREHIRGFTNAQKRNQIRVLQRAGELNPDVSGNRSDQMADIQEGDESGSCAEDAAGPPGPNDFPDDQ
jgi:hypothetical protein